MKEWETLRRFDWPLVHACDLKEGTVVEDPSTSSSRGGRGGREAGKLLTRYNGICREELRVWRRVLTANGPCRWGLLC